MKTITLLGVLFVLSIVSIITACKHNAYEPQIESNDTNKQTIAVDTPSFERDIFPIFKTSCASNGCHNATSQRAGYEYSSYTTAVAKGIKEGDAEGSKVYQSIATTDVKKLMPPGAPLLPKQQQLIKDWINNGAKNN